MREHACAHAVAHNFKLVRKPEHGYPLIFFMMSKARGNIGVSGKNRGVNASFFKAVGDLKSLIGWAANIGQKSFYST